MFAAVLNSPMLFFDNNPAGKLSNECYCTVTFVQSQSQLCCDTCMRNTGRVLNRFSKDVGYLDDLLPYTFCEYLLVCTS